MSGIFLTFQVLKPDKVSTLKDKARRNPRWCIISCNSRFVQSRRERGWRREDRHLTDNGSGKKCMVWEMRKGDEVTEMGRGYIGKKSTANVMGHREQRHERAKKKKIGKTRQYKSNCLRKTSCISYATSGSTVISLGLKIGWLLRQIIFEYNEQQPSGAESVP